MSNTPPSNLQKELLKTATAVILLTGLDEESFPRYYFCAIDASTSDKFTKQLASGKLDLTKDAVILEQGYGEPTDETWEYMNTNYGLQKDQINIIQTQKKLKNRPV